MKLLICVCNYFFQKAKKKVLIIWKNLVIFVRVFCHRLTDSSLKIPEERAAKVATRIERELFSFFRDTDSKYKNKYRSLMFNLKDPKNNVCIICCALQKSFICCSLKELCRYVINAFTTYCIYFFGRFLHLFYVVCLLAHSVFSVPFCSFPIINSSTPHSQCTFYSTVSKCSGCSLHSLGGWLGFSAPSPSWSSLSTLLLNVSVQQVISLLFHTQISQAWSSLSFLLSVSPLFNIILASSTSVFHPFINYSDSSCSFYCILLLVRQL